MGFRKSFIGI